MHKILIQFELKYITLSAYNNPVNKSYKKNTQCWNLGMVSKGMSSQIKIH